ncbi:MAG: hypothetical protein A2066_10935 [Bacteroidetes bacterium GWB2_41_8]|nr:MAG: hypothetical protein A2066_10935 [Bacteroidetes bacterium GWB2_41_8]
MDRFIFLREEKDDRFAFKLFVLKPDWLFLFHSMKRKQKSCQNEPSAGRFDGPRTRFEKGKRKLTGQTNVAQCLEPPLGEKPRMTNCLQVDIFMKNSSLKSKYFGEEFLYLAGIL